MALQGQKLLDAALKRYQEAAAATRTEHLPLLLASRVQVLQGEVGAAIVTLHQAILRAPKSRACSESSPRCASSRALPTRRCVPPSSCACSCRRARTPSTCTASPCWWQARTRTPSASSRGARARPGLRGRASGAGEGAAQAEERRRRPRRLLEEAVALAPGETGPANDLAVLHMSQPRRCCRGARRAGEGPGGAPGRSGREPQPGARAGGQRCEAGTHARPAGPGQQGRPIREQADRLVAALASKAK